MRLLNHLKKMCIRDRDGYWYKNETLIDRLGITSKEQKYMKTIIGLDEKYDRNNERRRNKRRNEEGLTKREEDKIKTIESIKKLCEQGYKQIEIVKALGLSKGRVSQVVKGQHRANLPFLLQTFHSQPFEKFLFPLEIGLQLSLIHIFSVLQYTVIVLSKCSGCSAL